MAGFFFLQAWIYSRLQRLILADEFFFNPGTAYSLAQSSLYSPPRY
jgi:hypothetical protein